MEWLSLRCEILDYTCRMSSRSKIYHHTSVCKQKKDVGRGRLGELKGGIKCGGPQAHSSLPPLVQQKPSWCDSKVEYDDDMAWRILEAEDSTWRSP
jgi:hypothetical protein